MAQATVTKTGNSYALRVPKSFVINNHLKLGDKIQVSEPLNRQRQALADLAKQTKRKGPIKDISDPVKWQRRQRQSRDPWQEIKE